MAVITFTGAYGPMVGTGIDGVARAGKGFQRYTVTNGAVTHILTTAATSGAANADVPDYFRHAIVQINGAGGVSVRDDGTDPTAAIGQLLADGTEIVYENNPDCLRQLRCIGVSGNVEVTVRYYY